MFLWGNVLIIGMLVVLLYCIMCYIFSKQLEDEESVEDRKRYILWVTTKDDNGYSSRWYGWTESKTFTYEEAEKEKRKIQDNFYDVEIVEF